MLIGFDRTMVFHATKCGYCSTHLQVVRRPHRSGSPIGVACPLWDHDVAGRWATDSSAEVERVIALAI
jgi:hypothetical protein